ncbi:hypothetical protein [Streptomyces sp. NPDC048001]|uniref:hypothetical protein n=1 Tax=Streptomyces sp. NPDC048001 TaxID=3365498 RepID=UPI0037143CF3
MNDLAKEPLSVGGQMLLLFTAGLFFASVGIWFLVSATNPGVINKIRSVTGFSPRGERETRIVARILGTAFTIAGAAAVTGGIFIALR